MNASERLQQGQPFGRYQIVRLIGEGGMGAVYEAVHTALKRRFAIKTLLPAFAQKEEARVRFLREGEAASMINHPNVVSVSDVGTEDGVPYLVMELLEGASLADFLAERKILSIEEAAAILLPVMSAVACGHESGVIHRDLKPANVFLARGRRGEVIPKVLDFGVSKLTGDDAAITRTMTVLGTASYMSPEQARGARQVDFRSDQYALGLILYEMLTGSRAHPGDNALEILHNVASGLIRPARELAPDLSPEVEAILDRMLAADQRQRYPSLIECARALLPFASAEVRAAMERELAPRGTGDVTGAGVVTLPPTPSERPERHAAVRAPVAPAAERPSDTTLRQSAGASETRPGPRGAGSSAKTKAGIAAAVAVAAVGGFVVWTASRPAPRPPAPATAEVHPAVSPPAPAAPAPAAVRAAAAAAPPAIPFEIRAEPPDAEIALDDRPPARGRLELVLPLAGNGHRIRVAAPGFVARVIEFDGDERPPAEVQLERAPTRPPRKAEPDEAATAHAPAARRPGPGLARKVEPSPPAAAVRPAQAQRPAPTEAPKGPAAPVKRGSNNAFIIQ